MNESCITTYNAVQQQWGTFLSGFDWDVYGCGTYRFPVGESRADFLMNRFMERLTKKVKAPVSFFAALERRYSGCGMSPIPLHWHFVAACRHSDQLQDMTQPLWARLFGNAKVDAYDASLGGVYYLSKLAAHPNGDFKFDRLELLTYNGPANLLSATQSNPYVPDHLKDRTYGQYPVVR